MRTKLVLSSALALTPAATITSAFQNGSSGGNARRRPGSTANSNASASRQVTGTAASSRGAAGKIIGVFSQQARWIWPSIFVIPWAIQSFGLARVLFICVLVSV
jgi:hypothetical protein